MGRSLYLLGKHKAAIEVYDEAQRLSAHPALEAPLQRRAPNCFSKPRPAPAPAPCTDSGDWELWHQKGLCLTHLKSYDAAVQCLRTANEIQRHDVTFVALGKVYSLQENWAAAVEVYMDALDFSPENAEILTTIGLLHLQQGDTSKAFDFLGNSLTHDPKSAKTILAAGSIIQARVEKGQRSQPGDFVAMHDSPLLTFRCLRDEQDHSDMDVALVKYRIAAVATPNSAQLWNNIGMCFFGKQRHIAAIACLKKALYHDPFEWIISYNLGLVRRPVPPPATRSRVGSVAECALTRLIFGRSISTPGSTRPPSTSSPRPST